jgi:hypothetical protein
MSQNSISCRSGGKRRALPGLESGAVDDLIVPSVSLVAKMLVEAAAQCPHAVFRGTRFTSESDLRSVFRRWLGSQLGRRFKDIRSPEFVSLTRLEIKVGNSGRYASLDIPPSLVSFLETPPEWIRKKIGKNKKS